MSEARKGNQNTLGKSLSEEHKRKVSEALKGRVFSEEHRRNLSEAGRNRPPLSEETRRKMSDANRRRITTEETRRKRSENAKNRPPPSEETRRKLSEANKGKKLSEETKRKIAKAHMGKKLSEKHRRKLSEVRKGKKLSEGRRRKMSGKGNPNWRGGISFEPYPLEFNTALKLMIRERDGFTCQLCHVPENGHAHSCHHIDYDKSNNDPLNLISLCNADGCHSRTNANRAFYTNLFQARMKMGLRYAPPEAQTMADGQPDGSIWLSEPM